MISLHDHTGVKLVDIEFSIAGSSSADLASDVAQKHRAILNELKRIDCSLIKVLVKYKFSPDVFVINELT